MNKNCISYWLPKIEASGVMHPKTILVDAPVGDDGGLMRLLDGEAPEGFDTFIAKMNAAAAELQYPVFVRCGYSSAKFGWNRTCFVEKESDIPSHVAAIIDYAECQSFMGMPDYNVWAVRKYITLKHAGIATRSGIPINEEIRFFMDCGKSAECKCGRVICQHPYWPADAVKQLVREGSQDVDELLKAVNTLHQEDIDFLTTQSIKVAAEFQGQWSLDWARGQDGIWYAIDMALAKESWHWPDCPHEKEIV